MHEQSTDSNFICPIYQDYIGAESDTCKRCEYPFCVRTVPTAPPQEQEGSEGSGSDNEEKVDSRHGEISVLKSEEIQHLSRIEECLTPWPKLEDIDTIPKDEEHKEFRDLRIGERVCPKRCIVLGTKRYRQRMKIKVVEERITKSRLDLLLNWYCPMCGHEEPLNTKDIRRISKPARLIDGVRERSYYTEIKMKVNKNE